MGRNGRVHRAILAAWTLVGACAWGACNQPRRPGEPGGGDWQPVVLRAADAIRLAPPPAGAEQDAELMAVLAHKPRRTPEAIERARRWHQGAVVRWNEIARDLVARTRQSHTKASRVYALVSVAQYDALVASWNNKYAFKRPPPAELSSEVAPLFPGTRDPSYPSEHAAVAGASAAVLAQLFPREAEAIRRSAEEHQASRLLAGASFASDVAAGDALGRQVAARVLERAQGDGAADARTRAVAARPGRWSPSPEEQPLDPDWGKVKPWLMPAAEHYRAPPPPPADSPQFRAALDEVRRFSNRRTAEQKRLAALWADGEGSYAPAGRWNKITADLVMRDGVNELRAARAFALVNMAMMDAGIAAWDTKYHFLTPRPSQVDPAITTPVQEPNSPSYVCSHAAFSGAAAAVLGHLFPQDHQQLAATAEEAAMSRVYGGIQFRFEGDAGLAGGRAVAGLVIDRARSDGADSRARQR
jgi:membrane-associated phospholipid phosphatase